MKKQPLPTVECCCLSMIDRHEEYTRAHQVDKLGKFTVCNGPEAVKEGTCWEVQVLRGRYGLEWNWVDRKDNLDIM